MTDSLSLSAVIMFIFGTLVCYGGLLYFLYRALRKKRS